MAKLGMNFGGQSSNPFPPALRGFRGVVVVWIICCALLLAVAWPSIIALKASDPDDYMRLVQVRDWLGGQGWFDVRQYRMNPPHGGDMHWSRLVDVPIAGFLWLFRLILPEALASAAAMTAVPLLQMLLAMTLLHRLMRVMGQNEKTALIAPALLLLFPLLTTNFMPLRIDHHGWQAILALACFAALRRRDWRGAALAGVLAAIWLQISLEGLALVCGLCGLLALRYLIRRETSLVWFLASLSVASALLFGLTRPLSSLAFPQCDMLGYPHIAAFATGAGLLALLQKMSKQSQWPLRMAALGVAGVGAVALLIPTLGACAIDPFHGMDGVVRRWWFDYVAEGLPIHKQAPQTILMLLWTLALVPLGLRAALQSCAAKYRADWAELAAFAGMAALLSLAIMRVGLAAQMLCVPLSAMLIARYFSRARAVENAPLRIIATLACVLMLTPSLGSAVGRVFERMMSASGKTNPVMAKQVAKAGGVGGCDLASLAKLPRGLIFTNLNLGPEILVRTPHSVVASGYHRNGAKIREVIEAFSGDPTKAEAIIRANHAQYVVFCTMDGEAGVFATRRKDNLTHLFVSGAPLPVWLVPMRGFDGALRVFAVRA
jgi:hypothetical protein